MSTVEGSESRRASPALCAFAIAAPQSIQETDFRRRQPVVLSAGSGPPTRRRAGRRKRRHRRRSQTINAPDCVQDVNSKDYRRQWSLDEVLQTLQHVWDTPETTRHRFQFQEDHEFGLLSNGMEDRYRKISCVSTSEVSSPVLLRRRLSAPETIMRKYVLAQQRSDSQGSVWGPSDLEPRHQPRTDRDRDRDRFTAAAASSDPNLSRNRDTMRKSTLMKRLWTNRPLMGNAYADWQYSCGKGLSTTRSNSTNSVQSSPEHGTKALNRQLISSSTSTSPKRSTTHRRLSPSLSLSPKHLKVLSTSSRSYTTPAASHLTSSDGTRSTTNLVSTTESTRTTTTATTNYSDKSDSAYTNSNSNFTTESNNDRIPSYNHELEPQKDTMYESATQTIDTTNLNVISNIQLSQDTLNLIYSQVMQDVNSTGVADSGRVVTVQQTPSFYLNQVDATARHTEHSRIIKYMISNVDAGSPYKPAEVPQLIVPRYSALPRTTSMEVNTSSAESTDREDTISLVDSLEDRTSPRNDFNQNVRKLSPPLPDNSDNILPAKPTSFYIPIALEADQDEAKTVADHFPQRLREKITKRQIKREEKRQCNKVLKDFSPRSDSNYISASDNGNNIHFVVNSAHSTDDACVPDIAFKKVKRKPPKTTLPSIEQTRKMKVANGNGRFERIQPVEERLLSTRKQYPKLDTYHMKCKESPWLTKSRTKEKLSPLNNTKLDSNIAVFKRQQSAEKRIEIVEILEYVEADKLHEKKSKIPVLVPHQKLPKLPHVATEKPTYLDFEEVESGDPKLDQLIANILIDTLHNPHFQTAIKLNEEKLIKKLSNINEKRPNVPAQNKFVSKYSQKFEVIPEEKSFQLSTEEASKCTNNNSLPRSAELLTNHVVVNNNVDNAHKMENNYQGKAAIADNIASLPKGWITFYTLHKSQSPDSTSDEGEPTNRPCDDTQFGKESLRDAEKPQQQNNCKDYAGNFDSVRPRGNSPTYHERDEGWSLTISGTSGYEQCGPEVEMRLKFPKFQSQQSSAREERFKMAEMPSGSRRANTSISSNEFDNRLPDIRTKSMPKNKRTETQHVYTPRQSWERLLPAGIPANPRPTKTSTRRYRLTHSSADWCDGSPNVNVDATTHSTDDRCLSEILRRFPELMEISGSNIVTERKPRGQSISDKECNRSIFSNRQR